MQYSKWAKERYDRLKDKPEYLAVKLMIEINDQLYNRMEELGLSQYDLAERIGKSQSYVSKLLNHGTNMTLKTLAALAMALELDIEPPVFKPKKLSVKPGEELARRPSTDNVKLRKFVSAE
ncbi:MAG: helix-turn-helix transcriptional regulator [Candidatus Hatepunaea meridiana]|nr:helix-turn-helix transcriptional regulator [Candidatus Hatepunaea meridiana]